jgi:bifunctional non-homologous end joining protein LigD
MFNSSFSVQLHKQKKSNSNHYDLRVLNKSKTSLLSWAIPKARLPKTGERILAIQTSNHAISYITFQGSLKNGDKVTLVDKGKCKVIVYTPKLLIVTLKGKHIKDTYKLVKIKDRGNQVKWLISKHSKK